MKINKKTTALISVVTGSVILATAAFANYAASNGYDVYKSALKDFVKERNYTQEMSVRLTFDGEELYDVESLYEEVDLDSNAVYKKETGDIIEGTDQRRVSETSTRDGEEIEMYNFSRIESGEYVLKPNVYINDLDYRDAYGCFTVTAADNDAETVDKAIRFAELAADMVVGDLKNNFIYMRDTDNGHEYSIELDSFQIPEIINAGMSLIGSGYKDNAEVIINGESSSYRSDDPFYRMYEDMSVKSGKCRVVVDDQGRLRENDITVELSGKDSSGTQHTLAMEFAISVSKYGETVPKTVDISGCKDVTRASEINNGLIEEIKTKLANEDLDEAERSNLEAELNSRMKNTAVIDGPAVTDGTTAVYVTQ